MNDLRKRIKQTEKALLRAEKQGKATQAAALRELLKHLKNQAS